MFQIAINRVEGGIRTMRALAEIGDLLSLRDLYERTEAYFNERADQTQAEALSEIRATIAKMTAIEEANGMGACLQCSHPTVLNLYRRGDARIVAIVREFGGVID